MHSVRLALALLLALCYYTQATTYEPKWQSLDTRPIPLWYDDAKFGIFMHWGVYSVPAYTNQLGPIIPPAEWFWKIWQIYKLPTYVNYVNTHFPPNTSYPEFTKEFTAVDFNATQIAKLVKAAGAKYFVFTTKHHDGYCMWKSDKAWNWNSAENGPNRDIVGELRDAILKEGDIHWGTYFSLYEWFNPKYLADVATNKTVGGNITTQTYPNEVMFPQLIDMVTKYKPEIVWADGQWEMGAWYWRSEEFLAWLFNSGPNKDTVVVNDRWGIGTSCDHGSYFTCADNFNPGVLQPYKWENALSLDTKAWGFRRDMKISEMLSLKDAIDELVLTISCGGNFLLNIMPDEKGRILPILEERLEFLGDFVKVHDEAIFGTKPWIFQNDSDSDVWYTSRMRNNNNGVDPRRFYNPQDKDNTIIYAYVLTAPEDNWVTLSHVKPTFQTKITLLGTNIPIPFIPRLSGGIRANIGFVGLGQFPSREAFVLKIEYAANQLVDPLLHNPFVSNGAALAKKEYKNFEFGMEKSAMLKKKLMKEKSVKPKRS